MKKLLPVLTAALIIAGISLIYLFLWLRAHSFEPVARASSNTNSSQLYAPFIVAVILTVASIIAMLSITMRDKHLAEKELKQRMDALEKTMDIQKSSHFNK